MTLKDSQKRVAGTAIIIIFATIELLFLGALGVTLIEGESAPGKFFSRNESIDAMQKYLT